MKLVLVHCHAGRRKNIATLNLEIHPDLLALYEEMGLIEIKDGAIDYEELDRLNRILRLKQRVGVNTIGASIIVDLLDKIEALQDEIEILRRRQV